jgi:CRISPR/Cas system CMR-associated protein Cmr1 (group 7 of RAMP superfamily)
MLGGMLKKERKDQVKVKIRWGGHTKAINKYESKKKKYESKKHDEKKERHNNSDPKSLKPWNTL